MKIRYLIINLMVAAILSTTSCITKNPSNAVALTSALKMPSFEATLEKVDFYYRPIGLFRFAQGMDLDCKLEHGEYRMTITAFPASPEVIRFAQTLHEGQRYSFPKVIQDYLTGTNTTNNNLMNNMAATQLAYEKLLSVKCFALGGIGFAGLTSPGESNFRVIASNTNALQIFQKILTNGTVEAQLYALCGIRMKAPDKFDVAAKPIIAANKIVSEMRGCIETEVTASNIVTRIKNGWYDSYLARDR